MTSDYALGAIHALLGSGATLALLTTLLAYLNLVTLGALLVLGSVFLLMWAASFVIWALWG